MRTEEGGGMGLKGKKLGKKTHYHTKIWNPQLDFWQRYVPKICQNLRTPLNFTLPGIVQSCNQLTHHPTVVGVHNTDNLFSALDGRNDLNVTFGDGSYSAGAPTIDR